jgi:hypothetical protein
MMMRKKVITRWYFCASMSDQFIYLVEMLRIQGEENMELIGVYSKLLLAYGPYRERDFGLLVL